MAISLLNSDHELHSKIFTIPEDWHGYVPSSLSAGDEYFGLAITSHLKI